MKNKKSMWITGAIFIVLLLIVGFQWLSPSFSAQNLTEEEANTLALAKYPGEIMSTTKNKEEYQIRMQLETGLYFIKIDAKNGQILSLEQIEKKENISQQADKEVTTTPQKNTTITEKEAINIAANYVKGVADDDAEFHQPPGQTPYYLVEVEIENNDKDREAIVQVDAYTGGVKSVNWDD